MPLTIKKAHVIHLCGRGTDSLPAEGPDARRGKKKHPGAPFRERTRKITFYLLLGLIYFVKVK